MREWSEKKTGDIKICHLNVSFQTLEGIVPAVKDLSVEIKGKRITGLVGESGSGKSVLGMSILKLLPKSAVITGNCWLEGKDIYKASEKEMCAIRGGKIALIPQNPNQSLNPSMKIGPQLYETIKLHNSGKNAASYAVELLSGLGLKSVDDIPKRYAFEMSGGMNQRIVSAMGICGGPEWIIADEPTKGLDAVLRKQVCQVLKTIAEKKIKSMLLITHDLLLAYRLCQDICVLYNGEILEKGDAKKILENPSHPYTKGLLNSLPSRGMIPIPDPARPEAPAGCAFYSRCPNAAEKCKNKKPDYYPIANGEVRCFLYA